MTVRIPKWAGATAIALTLAFVVAACTHDGTHSNAAKAQQAETAAVSTGFNRLTRSQQIPTFDYSQVRQTLIDVESAQATGATSTTAFYLEGVGLIGWCPSSGAPVPTTDQLSASQQYVDLKGDGSRDRKPIDQGEVTGVYTGNSTGTWTLCLDDSGHKFAKYWEGYTDSTIGVVSTYPKDKRILVSGITYNFDKKKKR